SAHFPGIELVPHSHLECSGNDGDVLAQGVPMRRDSVSIGHFQANGVITSGCGRITFKHRQLRAGTNERRSRSPWNSVRCKNVVRMIALVRGYFEQLTCAAD